MALSYVDGTSHRRTTHASISMRCSSVIRLAPVMWDFASLPQKNPKKFDANETPQAKATEAERTAFEEAMSVKPPRAFFGGEKK